MDNKKTKRLCIIAIILSFMAMFFPLQEFNPTTYINATSITSSGLTNTSGNNVSLISEMNSGYWEGNETNAVPWQVDIVYNNVTVFNFVDFTSRYFSSTGTPSTHEVELLIYCTTHNDYMELKDYSNEVDWYSRTYFIANSAHYILPNGTVFLRLIHRSNGNNAHRIWIDVARLGVQPQYEQINASVVTNIVGADNATLNQKVNKSGDVITGAFTATTIGGIHNLIDMSTTPMYFRSYSASSISYLYSQPDKLSMSVIGLTMGTFNLTQNLSSLDVNLDMNNKDILNCHNCANISQVNEKVNKSGDTLTGVMYGNFSQNVNSIDVSGGAAIYNTRNTTTGYASIIHLEPTNMYIQVTDGTSNSMLMDSNLTTFQGNVSLDNHSLLNCANCVTSRLINETIISTPTNITSFTVPVNNNGYELYAYINNSNASSSSMNIYVNGDTTATNYTTQLQTTNGAAITSTRLNAAIFMTASANAEGFSFVKIQKTYLNTLAIQSDGSRLLASTGLILEKSTITKTSAKITNITNITIIGDLGNSIGSGSMFRIFKVE